MIIIVDNNTLLYANCICTPSRTHTVPGSPPTHITLTKNSPTSITLSWSPPVVPNGDIVHYHAHLVECPTDTLMAVQTTETSVVYDNLHPYYTYKYSLTAATAVGVGPYSDNATVQLDEAGT